MFGSLAKVGPILSGNWCVPVKQEPVWSLAVSGFSSLLAVPDWYESLPTIAAHGFQARGKARVLNDHGIVRVEGALFQAPAAR